MIIGICYLVSKYKGLLMKKNVIIFCLLVIICTIPLTASDLFSILESANSVEIKRAISNGADVNARDEKGNTPLMYAAQFNKNPEVTRMLLDAGAEVNTRNIYGWTPLMYAAQFNKNPEVTRMLLDAGAEVNAKKKDGWTPLMYAAADNENPEVIHILLEAGADGSNKNYWGETALDYAKENEALKGTKAFWELNDASYK
jgi:ankyrin repeat protein